METRACDVFMFLLHQIQSPTIAEAKCREPTEHDMNILNHLMRRIINRARTPDEYEIVSDDVWPIGGEGTNVLWYNLWWTIEDFMSLLLAADEIETARKNAAFLEDEHGQNMLNELLKLPVDEQFPLLLLDDKLLAPWRTHLKCFFIWFSCVNDTRVERLLCKLNNVLLDELEFSTPGISQILSIRRLIPNILKAHIMGYCSWREITEFMFDAYERGIDNLSSVEDTPADAEHRPQDTLETGVLGLLFDPDMTSLGQPIGIRLVLHSSYPITPQRSSLFVENDAMDVDPPDETNGVPH